MKVPIRKLSWWILFVLIQWVFQVKNVTSSASKVTWFSGAGYIMNRLTNRPITSTEEQIDLEFQTNRVNASLFGAGSETQLLSLAIVNGWLRVTLHLPLTETDNSLAVATLKQDSSNPIFTSWKIKQPSVLHLDLQICPGRSPSARLDDNQWHRVVLKRTSTMLQVRVDDDLILNRLVNSPIQGSHFLHTQTITLGGPLGYEDSVQTMTAFQTTTIFRGHMFKAIFQADGLDMDILSYTMTRQHGFRVVRPQKLDRSDQSDQSDVEFRSLCSLLQPHTQDGNRNSSSIMFNFKNLNHAYVELRIPPIQITNSPEISSDCIQKSKSSVPTNVQTQWNSLLIQFSPMYPENGLVFVIKPQQMWNHFATIPTNQDNNLSNMIPQFPGFLGAELRNSSLFIIVSRNHSIWFQTRLCHLKQTRYPQRYVLQVDYTTITYGQLNEHEVWPLIRTKCTHIENEEDHLVIGPSSNFTHLEVITSQEMLHILSKSEQVTIGDDQSVVQLGRKLYVGGINFTEQIEQGEQLAGFETVMGTHQNFMGCIHQVMINGIVLDLESAIEARKHYLERLHKSTLNFNLMLFYDPSLNSLEKGCPNSANSNGEVNCPSNPGQPQPGDEDWCAPNKDCPFPGNPIVCSCLSNSKQSIQCQNASPVLEFDGFQTISIQFPTEQISTVDWIQFEFQTNQPNGTLVHTQSHDFMAATQLEREIAHDGELDGLRSKYSRLKLVSNVLSGRMNDKSFAQPDTPNTGLTVQILDSMIHVTYRLEASKLTFSLPSKVSDGHWHSFELIRKRMVLITKLDQYETKRNIHLIDYNIHLKEVLLGGQPFLNDDTLIINGLVGRMAFFNLNGIPFLTNQIGLVGPLNKFAKQSRDHRKLLPLQPGGDMWIRHATANIYLDSIQNLFSRNQSTDLKSLDQPAYPITLRQSQCYVELTLVDYKLDLQLSYMIRTARDYGLLGIWTNRWNKQFLVMEIVRAILHFTFVGLRDVQTTKLVTLLVNDSQWHTIEIIGPAAIRDQANMITIRVDQGLQTETRIQLPIAEHINETGSIYIGGIPESLHRELRPYMHSGYSFEGCLASFKIGIGPILNLLHVNSPNIKQKTSDKCLHDEISPGCQLCETCLDSDGAYVDVQPIGSSSRGWPHNTDPSAMECLNGGRQTRVWNESKCLCELTTFQGSHCHQAGTTLRIGSIKLPDSGQTDDAKSANPRGDLVAKVGFVQLTYLDGPRHTRTDLFILGLQLVKSRQVGLKNSTQWWNQMTIFYVGSSNKSGDYIHLYVRSGNLRLDMNLGDGTVSIAGPECNIQDGYYHRIRGVRSRNQVVLEVDQHKITYGLHSGYDFQFNNQEAIWVGYSPQINQTDFFHGLITGFYFNGLMITDLAIGQQYCSFVQVKRFGEVEEASQNQPKLGPNSPFQTTLNPSVNPRKFKPHLSSRKIFPKPEPQLAYFMNNYSTIDSKPKPYQSHKQTQLDQPSSNFYSTPTHNQLSLWLVICLGLVGLILISSLSFLIYRYRKAQLVQSNSLFYIEPHRNLTEASTTNSELRKPVVEPLVSKPGLVQQNHQVTMNPNQQSAQNLNFSVDHNIVKSLHVQNGIGDNPNTDLHRVMMISGQRSHQPIPYDPYQTMIDQHRNSSTYLLGYDDSFVKDKFNSSNTLPHLRHS